MSEWEEVPLEGIENDGWEELPIEDFISETKYSHPKDKMEAENTRRQELIDRGDGALIRARDVREMPYWERFKVGAGRETSKLMSGSAHIWDYIARTLGDDRAIVRQGERLIANDEENRLMREFEEEAGPIQHLGATLPYMATTAPLTAGANRLFGVSNKYSRLPPPPKVNKSGKVIAPNYFNQTPKRSMAADATVGGLEGGAHMDANATEGAIANTIAGRVGRGLRRFSNLQPNMTDPKTIQPVLDYWGARGVEFTPGEKWGSTGDQIFENRLRKDSHWADTIKQNDKLQDYVINREFYKEMGIDTANMKDPGKLSAEELSSHMGNIRKQYEALENKSAALFDSKTMNDMVAYTRSLRNNKTEEGRQAYQYAKQFLKDLGFKFEKGKKLILKDSTPAVMKGDQFSTTRRQLKKRIEAANRDGKADLVQAYNFLHKNLIDAMDYGMTMMYGKEAAGEWNKMLNKYAFNETVRDEGMDLFRNIDMQKLKAWTENNDITRAMTETGDKFDIIHKAAQLQEIREKTRGNVGVLHNQFKNKQNMSLMQYLTATQASRMMPLMPSIYLNRYMSKYPRRTGWLGMKQNTMWDPTTLTQPLAMPHSESLNVNENAQAVGDAAVSGYEMGEDAVENLIRLLTTPPEQN